jgi:hypothetical protein
MGSFAYYSPIGLGLLLTLIANAVIRERLPDDMSPGVAWVIIVLIGLLVGLACQLLLIGAQGVVAQVLPVPVGRSIRGRPAVIAGFLILGTVVLLMAGLISSSESAAAGTIFFILAAIAAVTAIVIYAWCWPMAQRDFAEPRRSAQGGRSSR